MQLSPSMSESADSLDWEPSSRQKLLGRPGAHVAPSCSWRMRRDPRQIDRRAVAYVTKFPIVRTRQRGSRPGSRISGPSATIQCSGSTRCICGSGRRPSDTRRASCSRSCAGAAVSGQLRDRQTLRPTAAGRRAGGGAGDVRFETPPGRQSQIGGGPGPGVLPQPARHAACLHPHSRLLPAQLSRALPGETLSQFLEAHELSSITRISPLKDRLNLPPTWLSRYGFVAGASASLPWSAPPRRNPSPRRSPSLRRSPTPTRPTDKKPEPEKKTDADKKTDK